MFVSISVEYVVRLSSHNRRHDHHHGRRHRQTVVAAATAAVGDVALHAYKRRNITICPTDKYNYNSPFLLCRAIHCSLTPALSSVSIASERNVVFSSHFCFHMQILHVRRNVGVAVDDISYCSIGSDLKWQRHLNEFLTKCNWRCST